MGSNGRTKGKEEKGTCDRRGQIASDCPFGCTRGFVPCLVLPRPGAAACGHSARPVILLQYFFKSEAQPSKIHLHCLVSDLALWIGYVAIFNESATFSQSTVCIFMSRLSEKLSTTEVRRTSEIRMEGGFETEISDQ